MKPAALFLIAFFYGGADVSWEVERLGWFDRCGVAWVRCRLYVEFMDDINVVVVYHGDAGCIACSGYGYSHLVAVGCLLG